MNELVKDIDIYLLTWAAFIPNVTVAVTAAAILSVGGAVGGAVVAVVRAPRVHAVQVRPAIDGPTCQGGNGGVLA